ncbi:MAG TPA: YdbL family protein [Caulobacteraceae bacterium]|nr:YdbL family protein [Caulobacteraceae bacterium]
MRKILFAIAAGMSLMAAGAALSQTPADKARVDAAKSVGVVGEQGDGYLGFVTTGGDASLKASVAAINTGRASVYAETAAKTGVTAEAAGQAAARQLYNRMPAGQWFKPIGGSWTRKS